MTVRTATGWKWILAAAVAAAAACGGGTSGSNPPGDGSGSGSGVKDARPIDAAPLQDFGCGGNTACDTAHVCCVTPGSSISFACTAPASCPANDQITCDGPDECGGGTPVCCGVDVPDGTGNYPQCGVRSLSTTCTTENACQTNLGQSCSETSKVQICHVSSECHDPQNPECCTFSSGGASISFCIDSTTASLAGATCH